MITAIAAGLVSTGDLETLADTTVVLLLLAFIGLVLWAVDHLASRD